LGAQEDTGTQRQWWSKQRCPTC